MKGKALKLMILTVAIIACLTVALYAAHSSSQVQGDTSPTVSSATGDSGPHIVVPTREYDHRVMRKAD